MNGDFLGFGSRLCRLAAIVWASPATTIGLAIGMIGLSTGAHLRRRGRVLEFTGGLIGPLLARVPGMGAGVLAMTLGHVILARSADALDLCRAHEDVHVRQYERWGPFFLPAYLLCSLGLWLAGKNPYRDNPFERRAFDESPVSGMMNDE